MSELLRLAELCEKAAGPDRELDRDILFATFPRDRVAVFDGVKHISTMTGRDGEFWFNPLADRTDCPYYTESTDDAMTLVPSDVWLTLDRYSISDNPDHQHMKWRVWIKKLVGDIEGDGPAGLVTHFATGATPALALAAASLRASDTAGVR